MPPSLPVPHPSLQAKLRDLVAASQSGDVLFFHFSGHGWAAAGCIAAPPLPMRPVPEPSGLGSCSAGLGLPQGLLMMQ